MSKQALSQQKSELTAYDRALQDVSQSVLSDLGLNMVELEDRLEMAVAPDCCCFCNNSSCNQGCRVK